MSFWLTESLRSFLSQDKENAKFLVVGDGEIEEGKFGFGIFCYTDDFFTAYRARTLIRQNPKNTADIYPNTPEVLIEISKVLDQIMAEEKVSDSVTNTSAVPELMSSPPTEEISAPSVS